MGKKSSVEKWIYIASSPVLDGLKIGFHTGTFYALYKRYQTTLTNKVFFTLFRTETPEIHEKQIHRIFTPYNISNEIFQNSEELFQLYCYMCKCITGCEKIRCYSRERYFVNRTKGVWQYQKEETKEENSINEIVDDILKSGSINNKSELEEDLEQEKEELEEEIKEEDEIIDNILKTVSINTKGKLEEIDEEKITEKIFSKSEEKEKELSVHKTSKGTSGFFDIMEELSNVEDLYQMKDCKGDKYFEDKLKIEDVDRHFKELDIEDNEYTDNPFAKWAFKGAINTRKRPTGTY